MGNFHRLAWIDANIRAGRYPNGRTIAEQFEISLRQAQRDVEYLRYSMGAPVEYSASKNGYYYSDQTFILPTGFITGEDKVMLSWLAGQYRMTGGEKGAQLADLFTRLGGNKAEHLQEFSHLPVFITDPAEAAVFNLLEQASCTNSKVRITYSNNANETLTRIIHPYKLFNKNRISYIAAYCEVRKEIRVFRLSRISGPQLLQENFKVSPLFREENYGPGIGFKYREPYEAFVEFDSPPSTGGLKLEIEHESGSLYKVSFYSSEEILSALLSIKTGFRIDRPNWLKERLKDRLEKIMRSNFNNDIICRSSFV